MNLSSKTGKKNSTNFAGNDLPIHLKFTLPLRLVVA